jgi:LytS/YehU family sensor histidine kinase
LVFAISTCISLVQQWLNTEETKNEIVREKLNTELSFLKSQINPHFFFNTLNNIYSLAIVGSENTAPAILKLSAIMRYIISDAQVDFVTLESEIAFINHFITLQQLRLTNNVEVNFINKGDFSQQMIAPLLFITFVENAFKYGVSAKESTKIDFYLEAMDDKILFKTSNKIIHSDDDFRETTGIGINNVKRRLILLYPNIHNLEIVNNQETFIVKLEIKLK